MANELDVLPVGFGPVSALFANEAKDNALAQGIQAGYPIMGYKGKVWSIRYRGEETKLMRPNNDGPMASIEAIIVDSADHLSKIFYEGGYTEGNTAPPDCFSNDGVKPDISSPKIQNPICATCPKNAWGSAVNKATGGKGKACGDFKRTAITPLADPMNEAMGGPMLLRIPAASLQEVASYANKMGGLGYPFFAIGTRISFDVEESYPKFKFNAIRPLDDKEAKIVKELRSTEQVKRIISEEVVSPAQEAVTPVASAFEQPPQTTPPPVPVAQAPAPVVQPVSPPPPPPVAPAPVVAPTPAVAPQVAPAKTATAFGGVAVAAAPIAPVVAPVVEPTVAAKPEGSEAVSGNFDDELERRLAELMPPA